MRISGLGGQGIVFAGQLLGGAAARQWSYVVQTQSYGSAARGGASRADVMLSDEPIWELAPRSFDYLIVMSQPAYDAYIGGLKSDGLLLYDTMMVKPDFVGRAVGVDAVLVAKEKIGRTMFANIVMLGAFCAISRVVRLDVLKEEVLERVGRWREENLAALDAGARSVFG